MVARFGYARQRRRFLRLRYGGGAYDARRGGGRRDSDGSSAGAAVRRTRRGALALWKKTNGSAKGSVIALHARHSDFSMQRLEMLVCQ